LYILKPEQMQMKYPISMKIIGIIIEKSSPILWAMLIIKEEQATHP
jgi:hypothetical protein